MSSIDDRVVNMQFNNAQFQRGVADTTNSLNHLKDSLKLEGATTGFESVQRASDGFSLQGIESALQNVSSHFGVFGAVGFTVIQDLTNATIHAGASMANALVGPLVQGGAQRALAIQQAKFQFQGLGLDIDATMNSALAAVKGTAFGLDDAATAAAQFGASGITATTGLEGVLRSVAGVAAQTGSSYSSVANIFESVAGNGRLMGQDLLQLSSRGVNAAAVLAKSMGKSESDIRDMVTKGKISFKEFSDAMNAAFGANAANANQTYSGALDNMHAALSRIGADVASPYFLGMRDVLNALGPLFDTIHTAIKPFLDDLGIMQGNSAAGLVTLFNSWNVDIAKFLGSGIGGALKNILDAAIKIGDAFKTAFHDIFPPQTEGQLKGISDGMLKFSAMLIPGAKALDDLVRIFKGFFAILDIGFQLVGALFDVLGKLFGVTIKGSGGFLDFAAKLGDWLVKLDEAIRKSNAFLKFFEVLGGILATPIAMIKAFFGVIADGIKDLSKFSAKGIDDFATDVGNRFHGLVVIGQFFQDFWTGLKTVAEAVWSKIKPIFVGIGDAVKTATDSTKNVLKQLSFNDATQAINTTLFAGFLVILRGFFGNLGGVLKGNGLAFVSDFHKVFAGLQLNLKALEQSTNAKTLEEIAISVALLAASAVALSLVDSQKMALAIAGITLMVTGLLGAFKQFGKMSASGNGGIKDAIVLTMVLDGIAGAILVLAGAIAILGAIPIDRLIVGIAGLVVILGVLVLALKAFAKSKTDVLFAAGAIAILAPSLTLLAGAVALLSALPMAKLASGVGAFTIILGEMVGTIKILSKGAGKEMLIASVAMAGMATSMSMLVGVVALLGAMNMTGLIKGLVSLALALAIMTVAVNAMEGSISGSASMLIAAAALLVMAGALKILGGMSWDSIGRALVVMVGGLAILAGAMALMGIPLVLLGAVGILAAAAAMLILAPALVLLGTMSWDAIGRGLTILASSLAILAVGGLLLIPASVGFLLLGAAILLLGTGIFLAASGVATFAVAIAALVAVGAGGLKLIEDSIQAVIDKLPALGAGIGKAIVSMAQVVGDDGPQMVTAFSKLIASMLTAADQNIPNFIITGTHIIDAMLKAADKEVPNFTNTGMDILIKVLNGIAKKMPDIITAGTSVIVAFIAGIGNNAHRITDAAATTVIQFVQGTADSINSHRKAMETAGQNLAWAIADGMTGGLASKVRKVVDAAANLVQQIPGTIKKLLGINSPSKVTTELGEWTGEGVAVGIDNKAARVTDSASGLGSSAVAAIKSSIAGISDAMKEGIDTTPTIRPVIDTDGVKAGAAEINNLLSGKPKLSTDTSTDVATSVALQEQAKNAQLVLSASNVDPNTGKQLVFNQYNNSPVALSTPEIYRQTQNQLSTLKGELGVVTQNPTNQPSGPGS